jgi:predicted SAM-dependent methyltransferase
MKLHLGCGRRRLEGYTNIDILPTVEPDIVGDITRLTEFEENSAGVIYASHVLEHIPRPFILDTLREWRRVLKPGGTLRVSVPDFMALAELYLYDGISMWRVVGPLVGRQDYPANTHYMIYDYEYLAWTLGEAGFYDIRRWSPERELPEGFDDYSKARIQGRLISLNLEATA